MDGYSIYASANDVLQCQGDDKVIPTRYLWKVINLDNRMEWINPQMWRDEPLTQHDLIIGWQHVTFITLRDTIEMANVRRTELRGNTTPAALITHCFE